ncbi:MAG: CheR family methyltransferase [Paracoccaceae bacterium]
MDGDDPEVLETEPVIDFPVIGIGASAGGLEAVTEMFRSIDVGTGMAFVLVMHLDPDHESLMVELLARKMHIEVRQIADGDDLERDCLHVIPPGSSLRLEDGKLRLQSFSEPRGLRRPIDSFFTSLAHAQGHKAACVILSGTGADGTAGLRIIKEYGGICAVQTPEEARYDGMPFSAISTKLVDFTLLASDLVPRLRAFFEGADKTNFPDEEESEHVMQQITHVIHKQLGHDFSGYKRSTLIRRLFRRLQVLEMTDPEEYVRFLKSDAAEQQALAQDFLINVTSFFRDRENFEIMRKKVIVPLIQNADASDEVRVWVPGCSSGQEAYSIAMMIDETCEQLQNRPLIQIFATDIDDTMIGQARRGQYTVSSFIEIPSKYQEKYTTGLDGKFEITKKIREMVRFSVHSLIQDPPFSKIDLISCRNLLIYLGEDLQKELFPLLHFSLKPGGALFLGNSENVTRRGELFSVIDQRARIFRRQNLDKRLQIHLPLGSRNRGITSPKMANKLTREQDFPRHKSLDASNLALYEHYAPPFVRVSRDGRILDSSGDLSLFIMSRPGDERDLGVLARNEVRNVVLPLVSDAFDEDRRRAIKDIEVTSPFGVIKADIIAHPMKDQTIAVVFIVKDRLKPIIDEFEHVPVTQDRRIADLQEELQANRLLLKSKVEEIETANEELKSSNEEMMSMNEELQSANEELTTANEELKNKIDELTLANADLDNFLQSADLAMVVLDRGMRIRHVTQAAHRFMPIKSSDQGRTLSEFNVAFGTLDLLDEIHHVIITGKPVEHTTDLDADDRAYFVRITPYFFGEGVVEGASLTVVDISGEVALRKDLVRERALLNLTMQSNKMGFGELDFDAKVGVVDAVAAAQFGVDGAGSYPLEDISRHWIPQDHKRATDIREAAFVAGEGFVVEFRIAYPSGETRWYKAHASRFDPAEDRERYAFITIDMTEEMQLRHELAIETDRVKLAMQAGRMGFGELDVESQCYTLDDELAGQLGLPNHDAIPMSDLKERIFEEDQDALDSVLAEAIETGEPYELDFRVLNDGAGHRWLRMRGLRYTSIDGEVKLVGPTLDITAAKAAMRHQETLVDEMGHRTKNLFAVISALVQAAPKANDDVTRFANDLVGRIVSLGRAYDLVKETGEPGSTSLAELIHSTLGPHTSQQAVNIEGPEVHVPEGSINTFALVLHELATNAIKHGAIHHPDGRIDITWDAPEDGKLTIRWKETVPGFKGSTSAPGFGTKLVEMGMMQMDGSFQRRYGPDGADIELVVTFQA